MGFYYALRGVLYAFSERNIRFHYFFSLFVIAAGIYFDITLIEWMFIVISIFSTLSAEMMNTALERVVNIIRDDLGAKYELLGAPKDIAAGAVLMISLGSGFVGVKIFLPRIIDLLNSLSIL